MGVAGVQPAAQSDPRPVRIPPPMVARETIRHILYQIGGGAFKGWFGRERNFLGP
jgi:hypothetical protein